jgi:hypothetical protein
MLYQIITMILGKILLKPADALSIVVAQISAQIEIAKIIYGFKIVPDVQLNTVDNISSSS